MEPDFSVVNLPTTLPLPRARGHFHLTHRFNHNLTGATTTECFSHRARFRPRQRRQYRARIPVSASRGTCRRSFSARASARRSQFSANYDGGIRAAACRCRSRGSCRSRATATSARAQASRASTSRRRSVRSCRGQCANASGVSRCRCGFTTPPGAAGRIATPVCSALGGRLRVDVDHLPARRSRAAIGGYSLRDPEFAFAHRKRVGAPRVRR